MKKRSSNSGCDDPLGFEAYADLIEARLPGFEHTWLTDKDEVIALVSKCGRSRILSRISEDQFNVWDAACVVRRILEAMREPDSVQHFEAPVEVMKELLGMT